MHSHNIPLQCVTIEGTDEHTSWKPKHILAITGRPKTATRAFVRPHCVPNPKIAEIHLLRHCRDRDVMFGRRDMEHKATEVYRYHRSLRDSLSDSRLKSLKSFRSIPLVLVFASIALPDQCLLRLRSHTSPTVPLTLDPLAYQSPPSATIASRRSWTSGLITGRRSTLTQCGCTDSGFIVQSLMLKGP